MVETWSVLANRTAVHTETTQPMLRQCHHTDADQTIGAVMMSKIETMHTAEANSASDNNTSPTHPLTTCTRYAPQPESRAKNEPDNNGFGSGLCVSHHNIVVVDYVFLFFFNG